MDQNPDQPNTNSIELGAIAQGSVRSTQSLPAVSREKAKPKKRNFSGAQFDLAKKFSEVSSDYSRSECKEAISIIASMYGLRLIPMGIALKVPEPAKAEPAKRTKAKETPPKPSVSAASRSDPQLVALQQERQSIVFDLKKSPADSEIQVSLISSLRELEERIKSRKAELKEEISSQAVRKAT